jgi:NAD+ diphosphatase
MINEIAPDLFNSQFEANQTCNDSDYILYFKERQVLLKPNGDAFKLPQKKDIAGLPSDTTFIYLFRVKNKACFLLKTTAGINDTNLCFEDINIFRYLPQVPGWACLLGFQLYNWYNNHQFCGKCGHKTRLKDDERAIHCDHCETTIYPNISPAIIVAIICKDRILLARGAQWPEGRFSLVAGYTDVGESLEETVVREVKEEVGLDIKNIRYYKNHPWPLSGSLMVGFIADADDQQTIIIDEKEIAEAAWFTRDNLPPYSPEISISGEMIDQFRKGKL